MAADMFNRRAVVTGVVAAGLVPAAAKAEWMCSPIDPYSRTQTCEVGLSGLNITATNASTIQEKQNWCWAACISGIFAWHGHPVSQRRIVEKIYGNEIDRPATGDQIYEAVSGDWEDDYGRYFTGRANPLMDTNYSFVNPQAAAAISVELRDNYPLIIGTQGHATILTAMTYGTSPYGQVINSLTVRDPWPDNPRRRPLSASEFANANLVMQIRAF